MIRFNAIRLKTERTKQKISQRTLAEKAETSERYIRDLEKGNKSNPSSILLCRICQSLKVSMDDLMSVTEEES